MVLGDKQRKTATVIDLAIQSGSNIRKEEHKKLKKYQRLREEREKGEGYSGPSGNPGTRCSDHQARRVAPADPGTTSEMS